MRGFGSCMIALVLVGCGRPADKAAEGAVGEAPAGEAPAGQEMPAVSLADMAGTWDVRAMNGDSTVVAFQMVATSDESGWVLKFPKRDPLPVRVSTEGDSVILDAGPYESVLRKGVQVTTRTAVRPENGKLKGTTVATYEGGGPDSVIELGFEGTRAP